MMRILTSLVGSIVMVEGFSALLLMDSVMSDCEDKPNTATPTPTAIAAAMPIMRAPLFTIHFKL